MEKFKEMFQEWCADGNNRSCLVIMSEDEGENNAVGVSIIGFRETLVKSLSTLLLENELFASLVKEAVRRAVTSSMESLNDLDASNIVDSLLRENGFKTE